MSELHVTLPTTWPWSTPWQELWTVVQWQDEWDSWHDVTSWQGTFDAMTDGVGVKQWWVSRADFATGPFRWQVLQTQQGNVVGVSESFHLPGGDKQITLIEVTLEP
jgi:hypothetical protein